MDDLTFASTIVPNTLPQSNGTTTEFGFHDKWQRILLALLLLMASVIGTIGNSLIILAVVLSRKLRSPTNVFVVNLSVADLLTCLALPWNIVSLLSFSGWPLEDWVCIFAAIVTYVPIYSSVSTLASIAINRLLIITQPIRVYRKIFCNEVLITWIILLWLCPFIVTVLPPLACDFGSLGYNDKFHSCSSVSSHHLSNEYDLYTALIIYPVPLTIIIACYIKIFIHVRHKQKKIAEHKSSNLRSGTEDSISLSSIDDTSLPPSPNSPTHHTQFSFPDHQRYVKSKTPPTSPLALATSTSPLSWPLPTNLKQKTNTENGRPNSSPMALTKTAAIKLAEELAESEPSNLPRSNSNGKISRSLSTSHTEKSNGTTLLEKWPRALSASDSSLNTIGTSTRGRPLSCLPHSRTAAARLMSKTDSNSLPTRRGRPASLTATLNRNNSFPLHSKAKDDVPVVIRRSRKLGRSLSKRIRNTIIEARVRISKRQLAITKNMFYVVIAFAICFTPFVFCLLIDTKTATMLLPYSVFLVFFNACINPAIYATKHPYFKKVWSKIIRCRWSEIPEPSDTLRSLVTRSLRKSR